jgi:phosphoribosylformylglycinamidine synthase subunit PurL
MLNMTANTKQTADHQAKLKTYRLNQSEFELITKLLGREPRGVEWALFSALWSEHCSYKSSKVHLKKLFNKSSRVLESFGENAGVVDLGQGERVAFKIESHNHPSYIEPYQGAATGVGGILRDIFTMGARPIALADYLCFGEPEAPRMTQLVDGVVRGIGGYGNCVGVPTVTGQTEFHKSYNGNILVNAMAVGLFRPGDQIFLSKAKGPGNWVVYVGAKTGRDGVHGASMASESFEADSAAKRPTVQIGDPFYEKLLIESCLEVMKENLVVAIQDMGAAGLTSSSFEMASKGGVGFKIHLDQVPLRDSSMTPEDILLSESQERMLLVCEPEKFPALAQVFHRWGLDAVKIGEVTEKKTVELHWKGELLTDIDPDLLVENAPQYQRPWKPLEPQNRVAKRAELTVQESDWTAYLKKTLENVRGTTRDWVHRQYDSRVGAATARDCQDSVGVVRLKDSKRALGVVLGCRPHLMRFDARVGGIDSIAYPALELALKGFEALAVTDCLNFGNPERENVMSDFVAALDGMNSICAGLEAPIISGNVSFYNETMGKNITPTPSTGLIGLRSGVSQMPHSYFNRADLCIYLMRLPGLVCGGVAQEVQTDKIQGIGQLDAKAVCKFIHLACEFSQFEGVQATRVVGKFGLAYALARMSEGDPTGADANQYGAKIEFEALREARGGELDGAALFEEHLYEALIAVDPARSAQFEAAWNKQVEKMTEAAGSRPVLKRIGQSVLGQLEIGSLVNCQTNDLKASYQGGWKKSFEGLS